MNTLINYCAVAWVGLFSCILSSCVTNDHYRKVPYRSDELQQMYTAALAGKGPREVVEKDSEWRASMVLESLAILIEENLTVENADRFFDIKGDQVSQKRLLDILRGLVVSDINPNLKKYLLLSDQGLDEGLIKKFDYVLVLKIIDLRNNSYSKNARKIKVRSESGIIDVAIVQIWEKPLEKQRGQSYNLE